MRQLFLAIILALVAVSGPGAKAVTLTWDISGVEATKTGVHENYPVSVLDGSAAGTWVINGENTYSKTSSTIVFTTARKTLQFGSANRSPVGSTISLLPDANPIPPDATIKAVSVLMKSTTESTWSLTVGNGTAVMKTAPETAVMNDCVPLDFTNLNFTGNTPVLKCESMKATGKYVYIAQITVTYEAGAVSGTVEAPVFSLPSETEIENGTEVGLSCPTAGATILCSINGGDYSAVAGTVKVTGEEGSKVTLKAYAKKEGMTDSGITTAVYTIRRSPLVPPYSEDFGTKESLEAFTTIDANSDGTTWKYNSGNVLIQHMPGNTAKNDWLITPAFALKGGQTYGFKVDVRAGNANYPEKIAVFLGTAPTAEAMTTAVIPTQTVDYTEYHTLTATITPETDGAYYIGICALSEANMFQLFVDDIRLAAGVDSNAPAACGNVSITNDPAGLNRAHISFITPTKKMGGENLSAIDAAIIYRDGIEIHRVAAPAPGSTISFVDELAEAGTHTYGVACANSSGQSEISEEKLFIGLAAPAAPASAIAREIETGKVKISWEAVTTNIYGQIINADLVKYNIEDADGNSIASDVTGDSYTYTMPDASVQQLTTFKVTAFTSAGVAPEVAVTDKTVMGQPYAMPYTESFARWHAASIVELVGKGGPGYNAWRIMREEMTAEIFAYDADDGMLAFMPASVGTTGSAITGKIHIDKDSANPHLSFYLIDKAPGVNQLKIEIIEDGEVVKTVPVTDAKTEWSEVLVPLSDFADRDIRIAFTATAGSTTVSMAVDHISVMALADKNLSITRVRVPSEMEFKKEHKVTVEVINNGLTTIDGYSVEILADNETVATDNGSSLARGDKYIHAFVISPEHQSAADYTARLHVAGDEDLTDNISEAYTTEIVMPIYKPVTNLTVTADAAGAHLSWNAPVASDNDEPVTETFERYDEFEINKAGEWSFFDIDGDETYGIHDGLHSFPNMAKPMAYIVFNGSIPTLDQIGTMSFGAHSGNQYLAAFAIRSGGMNNDWLVSPLLNGKAQTISFYARSMAISNNECFQVLYSTTANTPGSFKPITMDFEKHAQWTKFSYNLPEGTRYFAIRYMSTDLYALFIDDITYTPAPSELEAISGYDIYRDGEKLNEAPVTDTSWLDANPADGTHDYEVFAVMPRGLSDGVKVTVATSSTEAVTAAGARVSVENGILSIAAPTASDITVLNAQGALLHHSAATELHLPLPTGIYIVSVGSETVKAIVR